MRARGCSAVGAMTPASVLDAVLALLPVGVAVGDDRDGRLRAGCRGLGERRGQRPRVGVDDRLELGGGLRGGVDRVELHGVHGAERHQGLAVAVEEVAAGAARALELERLVRRRGRGATASPAAGWRRPSARRTPRPAPARCTTRSRCPAGSRSPTGRSSRSTRRARTSPAVTWTGASARSFTAAAKPVFVASSAKGTGARSLADQPAAKAVTAACGGGVAVGLALAPPERTAQPEGEDDDGGDDERDPGPHDPSQLCRGAAHPASGRDPGQVPMAPPVGARDTTAHADPPGIPDARPRRRTRQPASAKMREVAAGEEPGAPRCRGALLVGGGGGI